MNWFTTTEVAESLNISLREVQKLIKVGRIPAEKKGRDWLVSDVDLESYRQNRRGPGRPRKSGE